MRLESEQKLLDSKIEAKVKKVVDTLRASHSKFEDPDFGPNEKDEFGSFSLYGDLKPDPAGGSKYPDPSSLHWDRPQYNDKNFEGNGEVEEVVEESDEFDDEFGFSEKQEEHVWCDRGQLYLDGTSSGDVIQVE